MYTAKDILSKKGSFVASVRKSNTVLEAAREMNARRIGAVVVTDGESVVGIFTERDILTRVVSAQRDPETTLVGEVMTTPVAVCRQDTKFEECRSVMTSRRIRHLPVVEGNNLIGIITSGDLLAHTVEEHETTIHYLNEYIFGPYASSEAMKSAEGR